MRIILCLLMVMTLTGCLRNISFDGLAATGSSTIAAVTGTVVAGPTVGAIAGAVAGVATDAATAPTETTVDVLEALPEDERLEALKNEHLWMTIESLGIYSIIAVLVFFLLPFFIGLFMRKPGDGKIIRQAFNHRDIQM